MANISLKTLITEAEDFKARSKETGKLVHFKSKDSYDSALKAGTHTDPKDKKGKDSKASTKPNDMFGGDYAKDRGSEAPKVDGMATVNAIAAGTGLRAQAVAGWADENGVNLSKVAADLKSKKLKPIDFMTAVSGNPDNKYAKDIIAKYSNKSKPSNMGVDSVVYNTRTKTVGIVRMADERGETKTDADGNVNTSELEPYNPMKYPHQKDAKVAPSTSKEIDSKGLWKPFSQSSNNTNWMDDLDSIDVSDIKGKADPSADSWTHSDVFGATFKDPQTGKQISVGDAYDREDDSPAYQKAFAYVAQFNPDDEAVMGTQAYADLQKKATPKAQLPKKASELDYTHAETLEKAVNAETGLSGYVDTDDNTDAIMYNASSGMAPTYTLYFGGNSDYNKPDEFRVSLLPTYENDPSNIGDKIDKTFKSGDDAMAFMIAVAKKYKKELEMDDDTNESTKLTSMIKK
jgi:hypothetical protein